MEENELIPTTPKKHEGRWKKGQSGNPLGRPKKGMTLAENIATALEAKKDGDPSKLEKIIDALVKKAEEGDTKAIEILLDRGYGKAKAFLEISAKNEFEVDWGDESDEGDEDENVIDGKFVDEVGNEENKNSTE